MGLFRKLKDNFFSAFREVFIYHHNSLEFRAKLYALVIAANENHGECEYELVTKAGMEIYNDEGRANALTIAAREFVEKVVENNGLDIDLLIQDIANEVKIYPRYVKKINIEHLYWLVKCTYDEDTRTYQERIIEFLEALSQEYTQKYAKLHI